MSLKVRFFGAVGTVTGSCSLLHYEESDSYFLIDCGLYQGFPGAEERNRRKFLFEPSRLSAVLLTHAHLDHCGLLPRLVAEGFRGKIICTRITARFTLTALQDAANQDGVPYSYRDVTMLESMFQCPDDRDDFRFGYFYPLDQDLLYGFLRTAHVVGSVAIKFRANLSTTERLTITFGGDIGPSTNDAVHGGLQKRRQYPNPETSYLVCESTYGGRIRAPECGTFEGRVTALGNALGRSFMRGEEPVVIIPAFSLQRCQDLVVDICHVLATRLPAWRTEWTPCVVVDSTMAQAHSQVMCDELRRVDGRGKRRFLNTDSPLFAEISDDEIGAELEFWLQANNGGRLIEQEDRRWGLVYGSYGTVSLPAGPKIVIASAGNTQGGPVVKHLATHLERSEVTVMLSGYVPAGSPGRFLQTLVATPGIEERARLRITVDGKDLRGTDVKAAIEDLSPFYSGHADEAGLLDFALRRDTRKPSPPLTIFLNHGDRKARLALKEQLEARVRTSPDENRALKGVIVPESKHGWFDLGKCAWEAADTSLDGIAQRIDALEQAVIEIREAQETILARLKASG